MKRSRSQTIIAMEVYIVCWVSWRRESVRTGGSLLPRLRPLCVTMTLFAFCSSPQSNRTLGCYSDRLLEQVMRKAFRVVEMTYDQSYNILWCHCLKYCHSK